MTDVYIKKVGDSQEEINSNISEIFQSIMISNKKSIDNVIIKPNLCYYWDSSTGYTTDPKIVSGIIDIVREKYGDINIKVAESDASAMRTKYAFPILGYKKLSEEKKVILFNLTEDEAIEKVITINNESLKLNVPKSLLETDLFINVPKFKIMRETYISCALKNVFGCLSEPRKIKYHPTLSKTIVGVNKILKPDITIVDGIVALGKYPIKLNLIIGSDDPFAVDWVSSQIMGYNPKKIPFLKLALNEKLGNPKTIKVIGATHDFEQQFPKENNFLSKNSFKILLKLLNTYSRITGDIIPPTLDN